MARVWKFSFVLNTKILDTWCYLRVHWYDTRNFFLVIFMRNVTLKIIEKWSIQFWRLWFWFYKSNKLSKNNIYDEKIIWILCSERTFIKWETKSFGVVPYLHTYVMIEIKREITRIHSLAKILYEWKFWRLF